MPTFTIERWDSVIPPGKTEPHPMIYIKPDKDFIKYAEENENIVLVTISNTGLKYDTQSFVGIVNSSMNFPNDRPIFFDTTGFFVITLFARWLGYPTNNGSALIEGRSGLDKVQFQEEKQYRPPEPIEMYNSMSKSCSGFSDKQILMVVILIMIIFGILFVFSLRKKENI